MQCGAETGPRFCCGRRAAEPPCHLSMFAARALNGRADRGHYPTHHPGHSSAIRPPDVAVYRLREAAVSSYWAERAHRAATFALNARDGMFGSSALATGSLFILGLCLLAEGPVRKILTQQVQDQTEANKAPAATSIQQGAKIGRMPYLKFHPKNFGSQGPVQMPRCSSKLTLLV
jgi:hypothetical protein